MKLLYCPNCHDIVRIFDKKGIRYCTCRASFAYPKDNINVVVGGNGIPLGIADNTLNGAIRSRPIRGKGCSFSSYVIPLNSKSITYDKDMFKENKNAKDAIKRMSMIEND